MHKFRDWLMTGVNVDIKPSVFGLEVMSYLAYETVAQVDTQHYTQSLNSLCRVYTSATCCAQQATCCAQLVAAQQVCAGVTTRGDSYF